MLLLLNSLCEGKIAINKQSVLNDIWKTFKDALTSGVTTVTLTDSTTQTIQTYTESFPQSIIDEKSDYPIMIVNPPDLSWEDFTQTKKWANGTITIEIYSTKNEAADLFIDGVIDTVETNRDDFGEENIMFIQLDSTTSDTAVKPGTDIQVHLRTVTFSFRFPFTKTYPPY